MLKVIALFFIVVGTLEVYLDSSPTKALGIFVAIIFLYWVISLARVEKDS